MFSYVLFTPSSGDNVSSDWVISNYKFVSLLHQDNNIVLVLTENNELVFHSLSIERIR